MSKSIKTNEVSTTNATVTTITTINLGTDSIALIEVRVLARRTGGTGSSGDSATYIRTVRAKNAGGTVTLHDLQTDYTSEDIAGWDVTIDVSGTDIRVRVTGAASTNINWYSESHIRSIT